MITICSTRNFIDSGNAPDELAREMPLPSVIVQWDKAPGLFWHLRLCEYFGVRDQRWDYPTDAKWTTTGDTMSYADHPATPDESVMGASSASITVNRDELSIEITLQNKSSEHWVDAWGWVCLIHRWAGAFQANCELPVPWSAAAALPAPKERWLKWCPVQNRLDIAERIGRHQAHMFQPHIKAERGAVRAWRMRLGAPVQELIELSSPDAFMLGWSHWPCTDMGLYLGDLASGQSTTAALKLRFYETPYEPT